MVRIETVMIPHAGDATETGRRDNHETKNQTQKQMEGDLQMWASHDNAPPLLDLARRWPRRHNCVLGEAVPEVRPMGVSQVGRDGKNRNGMTDEEMRIAIAEALGWERQVDPYYADGIAWIRDGQRISTIDLPYYPNNLNAMHEAEALLDNFKVDDRSMYYDYLLLIAADSDRWRTVTTDKFEREWVMLRTTARQRAEAFLRTIGKWKD